MRFRTVLEVATPLILMCALPAGSPRSAFGDDGKTKLPQNGTQNRGTQNGGAQDGDEKIEKYKAMLRKVGPEARVERETAVEALSHLSRLEAHVVLHEWVLPGPDPDGVRKLVLERLPARLRNEDDKVFGTKGPNSAVIRRSYVAPLVRHFSGDAVPKPLHPRARELRMLARRSLVAMRTGELRATLSQFGLESVATRRQALRAAGQCQDLGLAELIAESLDVKELAPVAREALYDLTYSDFQDRAAFTKWFAVHGAKQYLDLAEDAARRAKSDLEELQANLSSEKIAIVVELMDVLATSTRKDKWKRIEAQVFPKTPSASAEAVNEVMRACLTRLREVLADAAPVQRGADATDRLAFFDRLTKRLDESPGVVDHALLLEVASYVCAESETEQRTAHQQRLLDGLKHVSPIVKRGALRGIRRFFAPGNRAEVVAVTRDARANGDVETLTVAVETLQSAGWSAPAVGDADLDSWVQGMQRILTDGELPVTLRTDVISVLCLSDAKGNKLERSFDLLLAEVGRKAAHIEVRQSVMLRLSGLIPKETGPREAAAEKYLRQLISLQTDAEEVAIRRSAAGMLTVPENVSTEKEKALGKELALAVGERLLKEKDQRVFEALVSVLAAQAAIDGLVATVNTRLRQALAELGGKNDVLAAAVVKGLKDVAVTKGRTTAEWTATCESLLKQRDRTSIRNILDFHLRDTRGRQLAGASKELQHRVWKLVILTARLAPEDLLWTDTVNRGEAEMVNEAFKVLIEDGEYARAAKTLDSARTRLTYLRCLNAVGKREVLTAQAELWLKDNVLAARDREEAQLLLAEGYLNEGKVLESWTESGIQSVTGPLLAQRLELQMRIAATMRSQKKLKAAESVLADARSRTKKDAAEYWPRLRQHIEVRFELDAKTAAALVKELDAWAAGATLTVDQRREVATLRAALQRTAKPPK